MKSKTFFAVFATMAIVPLALAYMTLKFGWFTPAVTNKGEFMTREVSLELPKESPKWRIVFQPQQNSCDALCEEQLYGLNQAFVALGKLQRRVDAVVLSNEVDLSAYPRAQRIQQRFDVLQPNYIYLVDPMGKVVLRYAAQNDREHTILTSKHILSDLKKLLKYERVG